MNSNALTAFETAISNILASLGTMIADLFAAIKDPATWPGAVVAGVVAILIVAVATWLWTRGGPYIPGTEEYRERVRDQRIRDAAAKQDNDVFYSATALKTKILIFSGDITRSSADIIVSSDDTLLSATGGVARSIAKAAGRELKKRLREIATSGLRQGSIAITGGGRTPFRYILHAIVLTKGPDFTLYPNKDDIERLIRRIVQVADAIGVESFAMPVLASGTASKKLKEEGLMNDQEIIKFIFVSLFRALSVRRLTSLESVFIVAYDNKNLQPALIDGIRAEI